MWGGISLAFYLLCGPICGGGFQVDCWLKLSKLAFLSMFSVFKSDTTKKSFQHFPLSTKAKETLTFACSIKVSQQKKLLKVTNYNNSWIIRRARFVSNLAFLPFLCCLMLIVHYLQTTHKLAFFLPAEFWICKSYNECFIDSYGWRFFIRCDAEIFILKLLYGNVVHFFLCTVGVLAE